MLEWALRKTSSREHCSDSSYVTKVKKKVYDNKYGDDGGDNCYLLRRMQKVVVVDSGSQ